MAESQFNLVVKYTFQPKNPPSHNDWYFSLFLSEKHDNAEATGTNKQSKYTTAASKGKIFDGILRWTGQKMHNCKSVYNLIYLGSLAVVSTSVRCIFLERHGPSVFSCYKLINWLLLLSLSDPQGYFWPPYFSSSLRPSYSRKVCFNIPFIRGLVNYRNWLVINLFVGFKSIISFFIYIVFITVFCT